MQLTPAQKTAVKTHIAANTNTTPATDANGNPLTTPFVINTRASSRNADDQAAIAAWYNSNAKANDNQPFSNRSVWNPFVTLGMLNSALVWSTAPLAGSTPTDAQLTNAWLQWQSMTWGATDINRPCLDMSDPQVRKGVYTVWGDVASGNASKVGGSGCGSRTGTNLELVCSNAVTGASPGGALSDAHPVQKDNAGASIYNQKINQADIDDIELNG